MAVSSSISLSLKPLTSTSFLKKPTFQITSISILPTSLYSHKTKLTKFPPQKTSHKVWRVSVGTEDVLPLESPIETTQEVISANSGDGVSNIISVLLFIAFLGLSILTVGVVYIAVTDFLQKREKDKFEKEEAAKNTKKKGKKGALRAKTGPKGFGQKIDEDVD
ncbi:hypothetical protein IFM89_000615 [Coptis chinensis]|uniref:Transmembrane protein n=1 Tax=Coptis chinensis TaxID=261450 RepID=A0A835HC05_9MAGN|nr:hypothetical protein IFM89_000615 [Coptis chinensis]